MKTTSYLLKYVNCIIEKEDYDNGCSGDTFHSWDIDINETIDSKEALIERMNQELCGAKFTEEDFNFENLFDGHNVQTDVIVSYKPDTDWEEFYYRTDAERKLWEEGKQDLYCAQFYFKVIPITILTKPL